MHSVIFRTRLLQECGLKLPEHTFYVDNLYVFEPLPYVKNMYYLDVNFYRYYIGRQDQSVNETVMISRIDQQIRVTKLMIDYLVGRKSELVKNPTSVPVHAQLSGDHHDSIFRTVNPLRYHRTSGEKERTVGVPERKRQTPVSVDA